MFEVIYVTKLRTETNRKNNIYTYIGKSMNTEYLRMVLMSVYSPYYPYFSFILYYLSVHYSSPVLTLLYFPSSIHLLYRERKDATDLRQDVATLLLLADVQTANTPAEVAATLTKVH